MPPNFYSSSIPVNPVFSLCAVSVLAPVNWSGLISVPVPVNRNIISWDVESGFWDMWANSQTEKQTDRHTDSQARWPQYFAQLPGTK